MTDRSSYTYATVRALIDNSYEGNFFMECALIESAVYVELILKLIALFNADEVDTKYKPLSYIFSSFVLNLSFEKRSEVVLIDKANKIKKFSQSQNNNMRRKMIALMNEDSVKLFDFVVENKKELEREIAVLMEKFLVLLDYGVENFLGHMAISIITFFEEHTLILSQFSEIFLKSSRKDITRRFIANKETFSQIQLDFCYNMPNLKTTESNSGSNTDFDKLDLDMEELCSIKVIILTAFDVLKSSLFIVFFFRKELIRRYSESSFRKGRSYKK